MHSFTPLAFAFLGLLSLVAAQSAQAFDSTGVTKADKNQWCQSQKSACPLLCSQLPGESTSTTSNTCDSSTLSYSCICSNGQAPNASEYSQTIPYFICTHTNEQCVSNCGPSDSACQTTCRTKTPCGAQEPKRVTTSASATASSTASSTDAEGGDEAIYTGFGGAQATDEASSDDDTGAGKTAADLGQSYGLALVLASLLGGFAIIL